MKEFIFNVCSVCLNPNRISRKSDKYDEFEISTAEHEGKWGVGVSYFYQLGGMSFGVYRQLCTFENETAAILHGVIDTTSAPLPQTGKRQQDLPASE